MKRCGGFREGAGRKSTWVSGCTFNDTKLIRVPSKIASTLLELAHKIDAEEDINFVAESEKQESVDFDRNSTLANNTQKRQESGRFAFKSNTHRLVRSIRLTDKTWNILGEIAGSRSITRADLIEEIFGNLTPDDLQKLDRSPDKHKANFKVSTQLSSSTAKQLSIYDFLK
jgi:predicted DNA-binding ribbon-helix-helix protein